eukprot:218298_1
MNTGGSFLYVDAENFYSNIRSLTVSNSDFSDITTASSLIVSTSYFGSWKVEIDIRRCAFLNIDLGSILVTKNGHIVNMEDVAITTKQLVHDVLETDESYLISLFAFSGGDEVNIRNMTLHYLYDLDANCQKQSDRHYGHILFYYIWCYAPIQLIQNIGTLTVDSLTVSNNIQYHKVQTYLKNNNYLCGTGRNNLFAIKELCEFTYTHGIDYAMIYNEGELTLNHLNLHGTGIHFQIIRNKGNTFLDHAITNYEYYYDKEQTTCAPDNAYCQYDTYTLNTAVYIRNDGNNICGGELQINNSYIYGAQFQAIYLTGGTNYIENTWIKQSRLAISASPDVSYLFIDNVKFVNVGSYYKSWAAIAQSIGMPPPLMLSAQQSVIQNCLFSFYDPWGFIMNSPRAWSLFFSSTLDPDQEDYQMTLVNNTFELNTDSNFATMDYVVLLKTLFASTMDEYKESLNDGLGSFLDAFDGSDLFFPTGLIFLDQFTTVRMIGNTFYGNDLDPTAAFISINNGHHLNCMSSNIIYGYSLQLVSGIVTSCYRDALTDIINKTNDTCWRGGLGHLDASSHSDIIDQFVATKANINQNIPLISIASSQSVFAAEGVSFALNTSNQTYQSAYTAIDVSAGHLLMFDVVLDEYLDISYANHCAIHCFEVINDTNASLILSQIYGSCTTGIAMNHSLSLLSDSQSLHVSHWSAASIQLTSTEQYYAGGKLYINYSIVDALGHIITDYDQQIQIALSSDVLNLHLIIIIESNGDCSICEQGIYIQTASIEHVGSNYTIHTSISNDELTVNDLTFGVIPCPSGFGRSGAAQQCEICTNGYFSLYPTIHECVECAAHNDFDLDAIACNGANKISIHYNYWIDIENYTMISGLCPPFRCCQNRNGCNYFESFTLCSAGRDPSSHLCSECLPGYTELIASVSCGICQRDYTERLLLPLLLAVLITFSIVFSTSAKVTHAPNAPRRYNSVVVIHDETELEIGGKATDPNAGATLKKKGNTKMKDLMVVFTIMMFNPIAYYFQSMSYVIAHSQGLSLSIYLASFV